VLVEPPADKTLVYWGTPQVQDVLEAREWPRVYRERNEMQELSFKGMSDHGGLDINDGRKTIRGPDRHQQRKQAQLAQSLETAHTRVDKKAEAVTAQQDKVAKSEAKGHGTRLEQRQRTLVTLEQECKEAQAKHAKLSEQAAALGPAGQRADRDFRTQTIMTIRTLWLENMLLGRLRARSIAGLFS
jgi:chromosome segregation ATPase